MLITKSKPKLRLENDLNKKCNFLSNLGGNFEMLITKSKPKLRLENDLNKKCNFLSNLAKFY